MRPDDPVSTACLIIDRNGAMPVPPAMNRKRRSGGFSGKTNDPDGPRTDSDNPLRRGLNPSPHRPPLSNLMRNWIVESTVVSSGADAIEYGTRVLAPGGLSEATWPARYGNAAPSRLTETIEEEGVALRTLLTHSTRSRTRRS